ncbi:MAG: YebG family protein [Colwellia sp.]|nr:YebG family protein [Colwellia sp.]
MAVESRFVVIRNGIEAKTFMDKKSADEYDKMLDMADNLGHLFSQSSVELSDSINEELSIYLAQHREEVLIALLAKKPAKPAAEKVPLKPIENIEEAAHIDPVDAKKTSKKSTTAKVKKSKAKAAATKLSEAS